jgi:8-oxo-dGTP pyrophosphatase MutT (NUDIX family)
LKKTRQVGTLPLRVTPNGLLEVLLVTSRETGRWVIPKGWPCKHMTDQDSAAREAKEEAGVHGRMVSDSIGAFHYMKREPAGLRRICVDVFAMLVDREMKRWPEQNERRREWFPLQLAALKVREPKLRKLLSEVGPSDVGF